MTANIMLTPLGWPIAFGLFGLLLTVGGWIVERIERREAELDESRDRHPSRGPR